MEIFKMDINDMIKLLNEFKEVEGNIPILCRDGDEYSPNYKTPVHTHLMKNPHTGETFVVIE